MSPLDRNWAEAPHESSPDFGNLLAVLERSRPRRATLFELFLNGPLYARLAGDTSDFPDDIRPWITKIKGFMHAGYDHATINIPGFGFPVGNPRIEATISLNDGAVITDRASFDAYAWPDPATADYGLLDRLTPHLPQGMKLIICGPQGVLENVISLVGYENLCYMTIDDPALAGDVFQAVGSRMVAYYTHCVSHECVGAIIGNDDWGFKSQTMLPPDQMRNLVFPWHKRLVDAAHAVGKPAILHSCGYMADVMDDIIDDMKYDGKHSYEDVIRPVEDVYDQYHDRIAILGGMDLDFVCRSDPDTIYERARRMLSRGATAYALGTGNSVPEYVPDENCFAMIRAALDMRQTAADV